VAANNDQVQYPQTQSQNTQVAPPRPQKKWPQKQTPIVSYPAVPNETDQSYPVRGSFFLFVELMVDIIPAKMVKYTKIIHNLYECLAGRR